MGLRVYTVSTASLHSAYAMRTHVSYAGTDGHGRKKLSLGFAKNKGADQHAHPRSLVSDFIIRFLESIISKRITSEIPFFLDRLCSCGDWFESPFVGNAQRQA